MFYSAFIIGLLGSLHCIGMCGPIAFALPVQNKKVWTILKSRLLYNMGRVLTYTLLGLFAGLFGRGLLLASSQQVLSILIGLIILLIILLPSSFTNQLNILKPIQKFIFLIKQQFGTLFKQKTNKAYLTIGLLNGFLPCGMVYLALAGAIATGDIYSGMIYMTLFGLGTLPLMLTISFAGNFFKPRLRSFLYKKMVPVFTIMLAMMFIMRGLNLGVPYLSPKISKTNQQIEVECCEVK